MDREEFGVALLLSFPVALGVATGVLKQTLGSQPAAAFVAGLTAGAGVFAVVVGAVRTTDDDGALARLERAVGTVLPAPREAGQQDLLLAGGMGALVTVFVWYIPGAPLLGGVVAGVLAGGTSDDALAAGMLSGAIVPVFALVVATTAFVTVGASVFGRFPFGPAVAAGISVVGVVYAVGFGRAGGWLGWKYLSDDADWGNQVGAAPDDG
jgi:hypothetical protein